MIAVKHRIRTLVICGAVALGGAAVWMWRGSDEPAPSVRTAAVTVGDIRETVRASGVLEGVTTVAVGTQVSGVVSWLGADFNSVVRKGQVIARLDPSLLQTQVAQARANRARVDTDVRQREVMSADRQAKYERATQLSAKALISQSDLEDARLAAEIARTDLDAAKAQVVQAQASLDQALVNLNHAVITAPIDGVVIQRSVDVGQTVAASLSSPTLFSIVGDLTKMRVNAAVDESDIAKVAAGQRVDVSVDAYPGRQFNGTVAQVRLQPTVVSNVTTYTTIVDVSNERRELMPGMTASTEIEIDSRTSVVRVPNTALRFRPTAEIFAALGQPDPAPARGGSVESRAVRASTRPAGDASEGTRGQVWLYDQGVLRRVDVRLGLADGVNTELLDGQVNAGTTLVTGVTTGAEAPAASPANNIFGGSRGRGRG
jgi:HlyD family secretion protein